jgi:DNA-binding MarR family transcriptional regulator
VRDERTRQALSSHQARVLDHLDPVAPTHLKELAAHLGITPPSMSLMIDRLERGGFVRRSRDARDARDARQVNLRLTRAGVRIKERQKVLDPEIVEAMLRRLPALERQSAVAGLQSLARAASELVESGQGQRIRKEIYS